MSEENENSVEEEKNNSNEKENENEQENENNKEKENESDDEKENEKENFTTYEDDLITLLNKLSETIDTFNTLSKKQADNAILETNIKITNCKSILDKMEEYINELKTEEESEKAELNKKLLNYKTEYYEILNKFKEIQDNYINQKTESALMDENLIDDEDNNNKNDIRMTTGTTGTHNLVVGAGNPHMVDGELNEEKNNNKNNININNKKEKDNKNNENIKINNLKNNFRNNYPPNNEISLVSVFNTNNLGYNLSPNKEKEETFQEINRDYDKKKKLMVIVCVAICIFIFLLIFLIALLS